MTKTNKIVVLAHARSRLITVQQKLNAIENFEELKKQLCTLGLKCSKETLISDSDSCKKMLMLVGIYAKNFFKTDLSNLENRKSVPSFDLGNEIKNVSAKNPLVLAVHDYKTTTILNELGIRGLEKEPSKEQIIIVDLNEEKILYQSRKIA